MLPFTGRLQTTLPPTLDLLSLVGIARSPPQARAAAEAGHALLECIIKSLGGWEGEFIVQEGPAGVSRDGAWVSQPGASRAVAGGPAAARRALPHPQQESVLEPHPLRLARLLSCDKGGLRMHVKGRGAAWLTCRRALEWGCRLLPTVPPPLPPRSCSAFACRPNAN